jgi:predicted lipoprotein with Yx(FWY)xxD motif
MGAKQMIKLAFTTAVAVVAFSASAFAASYSVTEISSSGIKRANGTWTLSTDGGKVSGKADLQLDNGSPVTYKLDGKVEGGAYTVNLVDRTDGKKDCVWTGKPNEKGSVFEGPVTCGSEKFVIRAGVQ